MVTLNLKKAIKFQTKRSKKGNLKGGSSDFLGTELQEKQTEKVLNGGVARNFKYRNLDTKYLAWLTILPGYGGSKKLANTFY